MLGDIGALYSTISYIGLTIVVQIFRVGNSAQLNILNRVFKRRIPTQDSKLFKMTGIRLEFKDWLLSVLCRFLRKRIARSHSYYDEAVTRFERELDVARLIKSQIVSLSLLKAMTTNY
jgi:hypothetical protein